MIEILCGIASIFYFICSFILLKFPTLLHKKKINKVSAFHTVHRGGSGERTENTLTAFAHSRKVGCGAFEFDVRITADKKIVIVHDDNLVRLTGKDILLKSTKYNNLPPLKQKLGVWFYKDAFYINNGKEEKIPLLEDLLKQHPGFPMIIEIKENDDDLIQRTNELIIRYKREDITAWGSFSEDVSKKLYKQNPNIPLLFSRYSAFKHYLCFYLGLLPFMPIKESNLNFLMPSIVPKSYTNGGKYTGIYVPILHLLNFFMMSPTFFNHLQKRGITVILYVLNTESDFEKALNLSVNGIMTDYPSKLKTWSNDNHHFKKSL